MEGINRRTAMAVGLTVAAAAAVPLTAEAAMYGPEEGELFPAGEGIRVIALSERPTAIEGFKSAKLLDLVFQPGAKLPDTPMNMAMICHMIEGELEITNNGEKFTAKKDQVWTCNEGGTEAAENLSGEAAVMRVAQLLT